MYFKVLIEIFCRLDDISLIAAGSVCRRWRQVK